VEVKNVTKKSLKLTATHLLQFFEYTATHHKKKWAWFDTNLLQNNNFPNSNDNKTKMRKSLKEKKCSTEQNLLN
jgi:hypothetical protein